jgi:hypothetical protein
LDIEFNDMSLNIQASLDIIETETWAIISDFRINNVGNERNFEWNFNEKYYNKGIELIKEWLEIWYEEWYSEITNSISTESTERYSEVIDSKISTGKILIEDEVYRTANNYNETSTDY